MWIAYVRGKQLRWGKKEGPLLSLVQITFLLNIVWEDNKFRTEY
jgi:hypothetical protein